MRHNNTSGTRVNNTQTTPRAKKSRTAFYRCHLKANKPLFSSDRVDYTNVIRATCEEHDLGCFLAQFRVLYPAYAVVVGTILVSRVFPSKSNR